MRGVFAKQKLKKHLIVFSRSENFQNCQLSIVNCQFRPKLAAILFLIAFTLTLAYSPTPPALAASDQGQAADLLDLERKLDLSAMEQFLQQMDDQLQNYAKDFSLRGIWADLRQGRLHLDLPGFLKLLLTIFGKEVATSGRLLTQLIALAILCLIVSNLKNNDQGKIVLLSRGVIYLVLATIVIASFSLTMEAARSAIDLMSGFLYAVLPILMALLAAVGGITAVTLVHPAIIFTISVLINLIRNFIFPLIYFSAILRLVSHISPRFNVDKMAGLFKDIAVGAMSIGLTVFISFLSLAGLAGASFDGITIKAAKTASGIFIPVVGRSLADALDSVLGTTLLLKNIVGIVGVLGILLICALPAVKILVQVLMFRLAAAAIQPLGETELANALSGLAGTMLLLFAAVAVCGLLFFFILAIVLAAGNITMMMR
jgi:stage III sporulation protein AE